MNNLTGSQTSSTIRLPDSSEEEEDIVSNKEGKTDIQKTYSTIFRHTTKAHIKPLTLDKNAKK